MPNIVNFFGCFIGYVFKASGQIKLGHFIKRELPIVSNIRNRQGCVAVPVASDISQPNVVPPVGEHKCWGLIFVVQYESV